MFEKDYLMRLIQNLFDSINKIINCIDKNDINGAKEIIDESFDLLGQDSDYYISTDINAIVNNFKSKDQNYLNLVEILSHLLYLKGKVTETEEEKKKYLVQTKKLIEHYNNNSNDFSIQLNNIYNKID